MTPDSLKNRILLITSLIVLTAVITITSIVLLVSKQVLLSEAKRNARNQNDAVTMAVENQYKSILFYRDSVLERRKTELRNLMDIAFSILEQSDSQSQALEELKNTRFDDGIGYFWINDLTQPFPRMIMHPTLPELNGQILDNPVFDTVEGNEKNLFRAAVQAVQKNGEGFIQYKWPKPMPGGVSSTLLPKISIVRLYKPWGWVIGSGVYLDDIEKDTEARLEAVKNELRQTLGTLSIGKNGYYFIFDGNKKIILHPSLEGFGGEAFINPDTGASLFNLFTEDVFNDDGMVTYIWNSPDDPDNFRYRKISFINYFEPLDWYIASSVYAKDIYKPLFEMIKKISLISGVFMIIVMMATMAITSWLIKPLKKLTRSVEKLDTSGIPFEKVPVEGPLETRHLGSALNAMIHSIKGFTTYVSGIMDAMPSLIIALDSEFRITNLNQKAKDSIPNPQYAEGKPLVEVFPNLSSESRAIHQALIEKRDWFHANIPKRDDNGINYHTVSFSPFKDGGGVLRVDDVTEQVKLEEILIQSEKMLSVGGLASGMAHEINNPLAGILQNIEVLQNRLFAETSSNITAAEKAGFDINVLNRYLEERKIGQILNNISNSGKRASELVRNMLSFARKDDGTVSLHNIPDLLDATITLAETDLNPKEKSNFKSIIIKREYCNNPALVQCSGSKIQQVFFNILRNGAEEMLMKGTFDGKPPRFTLRVKQFEDYLQIEIEDNGPGMSEEVRRRIFEPFFTTKKVGEGTGIGLSLSYFIITENHGGKLHVDSAENRGSCFTIQLPLRRESV